MNGAETRGVYTEEQTGRQAGPGEAERAEGGRAEFWRRGCTGGPRAGVLPSLSGGSSFSGPSSALSMARARLRASRTACSSRGSGPARTWVSRSCTSCPTAVCLSCVSAAAARPTCRSGASREQKAALMDRSRGRRRRWWPMWGEVAGLPWDPGTPSSSELLGEAQSTSWREGSGGRLGPAPPGTRYPTELSLRSSWRGGKLSVWLGAVPGNTGTGGGGTAGGDRGLEVSVDTRTLKLLLNFSRLVGPRSPGNKGLKKHKAAPVPWSSSCGGRGFSRGSGGPSDEPGWALVFREELQNSRKEKQVGPWGGGGGGQEGDPAGGKAQASGCVPSPSLSLLASACPSVQWVAREPLPMPRWEMASSSLWVAAWRMALGS